MKTKHAIANNKLCIIHYAHTHTPKGNTFSVHCPVRALDTGRPVTESSTKPKFGGYGLQTGTLLQIIDGQRPAQLCEMTIENVSWFGCSGGAVTLRDDLWGIIYIQDSIHHGY